MIYEFKTKKIMSLPNELVCIKYAQEKQKIVRHEKFKFRTLKSILSVVSSNENIPIEALKAKGRKRENVEARAAYFIIAKKNTLRSLDDIGAEVNRDHSTVLHHLSESNEYPAVKEIVNKII